MKRLTSILIMIGAVVAGLYIWNKIQESQQNTTTQR